MDYTATLRKPIPREEITSSQGAKKLLQRREFSADQLHYSLQKYDSDPAEIAKFGAFLGRWPMYSEGPDHRDAKRMVVACIVKARERVPLLAPLFMERLAQNSSVDEDDLAALNDIWQSSVMGVDPDDYAKIIPDLEIVTSFFTTYSAGFDFSVANAAVQNLRDFVETYTFTEGSLLTEGSAQDLHSDVLVNLLADPRPSMLHCMRVLLHLRGSGPREDQDRMSSKEIVENLLRELPPFGSIYRIVETADKEIEKTIRVDIRQCNAEEDNSVGMTFGFGRHTCPAGNLISDSLITLWDALLKVWPDRPVNYTWQGIPCMRSNPLRDQRALFVKRS
jgi:hypothetical protein